MIKNNQLVKIVNVPTDDELSHKQGRIIGIARTQCGDTDYVVKFDTALTTGYSAVVMTEHCLEIVEEIWNCV